MSNLKECFGNARWVAAGEKAIVNPVFRGEVFLPCSFTSAAISICGLGYSELYINGKCVSDDLFSPVTSDFCPREIPVKGQQIDEEWRHRCYYRQWDLGSFLHSGINQIAVSCGPGFFATPLTGYDTPIVYGQPRLIFRISWQNDNGSSSEFLSCSDNLRVSKGIVAANKLLTYERQDLRIADDNWTVQDFSAWDKPVELDDMDTTYVKQECESDRIVRRITPRKLMESHGISLWDAGENITGWVVMRDRSSAGERISVLHSEEKHGNDIDPGYTHGQNFEVISDGKGRLVHPKYIWYGFRYFKIEGKADAIEVDVIHSAVNVESKFHSSSPLLNWMWDAYIRTELDNWHGGIPSDCPHIERRGYTGDGQLTAETFLLLLNNKKLCRKWIDDICDCQDIHSGHVQYAAPYSRCGGGPGGWGIAIIQVPFEYFKRYGETEVLSSCHENMCRYIDFLKSHSENNLVVSDRPGQWCLGDWCIPGHTLPEDFVNTCFMIKALQELQEIDKILGLPENLEWQELIEKCAKAITDKYFDNDTGNFIDGKYGSNAFGISCGLGEERTKANMVRYYDENCAFDTGIFGTELLTRLLFQMGENNLAYRLITSEDPVSFAGWMDAGATTFWEYFPGSFFQRSLNHPMFGAIIKEFVYRILGITQRYGKYGWHDVVISPVLFEEIPEASGCIPVEGGSISVSYKFCHESRLFEIEAVIPEGISAAAVVQGNEIPLHIGINTLTFEM